jgi:RHS repeat-associated protein
MKNANTWVVRSAISFAVCALIPMAPVWACKQPTFIITMLPPTQLGSVPVGTTIPNIVVQAQTTDYDGVADSGGGQPTLVVSSGDGSVLKVASYTTNPVPPPWGQSLPFTIIISLTPEKSGAQTAPITFQGFCGTFPGPVSTATFGYTGTGAPGGSVPPTNFSVIDAGMIGHPVSTATGELYDADLPPDLSLGGPLPLVFKRYYASLIRANGITTRIGNNWMHNFEYVMTFATGTANVVLFGGRHIGFQASGNNWQLAKPDLFGFQLVNAQGGGYQFLDPATNLIYSFASTGGPTKIQDRNGNVLNITPPANGTAQVADGLGRSLTLSLDASGNITKVQDQTGRSVAFAYSGGDLAQVTDANGKVEKYSYTTATNMVGLMTARTLPVGNAPFTQVWNASGQVTKQSDSRGNGTLLAFDPAGVGPTTITDPLGVAEQQLHVNFNEVSYKDPDGNILAMGYDANGHRNSVTDRLGNKIALTFHTPSGYLASATDALGNATTLTWQAQTSAPFTFYNLAQVQYSDGSSISFAYDSNGNVLAAMDQAGKVWKYTYNSRGQRISGTDPLGRAATYAYNASDATLASVTDTAGNQTAYSYDSLKRVNRIAFADGATRSFTYDNLDNILSAVDERGKTTSFAFNDNDRLQTATDALAKSATIAYNADEQVSKATDRTGQSASYAYDRNDLLNAFTTPAGETFTFTHDSHQRLSAALDPNGNPTSFAYDKEDLLASSTDALSRKTAWTRDAMGRTTAVTTPLAESYKAAYDKLSRVTSSTDPAGIAATASYDPRGLVNAISIGGLSVALSHDDSGLLTAAADPNANAWSFGYDSAGRLASRSDPLNRATSYSYDKRNRVAAVQLPAGSVTNTYDAAGNLLRRLYSDGTDLNYTFDDDNGLTAGPGLTLSYDAERRIAGSNGLVIANDANGRIRSITYANGKTVAYAYNPIGLLSSVTDWVGGSTTFTYDAAHQLTAINRPNGKGARYTYDPDGRIASITEDAGSSIAIQRDAAGKAISETRTQPQSPSLPSGTLPLAFDAADQVSGFTYDANGRLNADLLRTYTWDLASRLTSYSGADGAATAAYDGLGLRTSLNSPADKRNFVWNYATSLPSLATVQDSSGDRRYYVYLPGGTLLHAIDAATNARHFYHFDENGSTVLLTNDAGAVTDSYGIAPYGETVTGNGSTENPFTWLGQWGVMQEGSTGLYYMRARYYDSTTARFLSPDPILSVHPMRVNPYQYARANPLRYADPRGTLDDPVLVARFTLKLPRSILQFEEPAKPLPLVDTPTVNGGAGQFELGGNPISSVADDLTPLPKSILLP